MDELERDLERLLRDDKWRLEPEPDALDRVHSGAARRSRRRRATAGTLSAVSVVAVAVVGVSSVLQTGGEPVADDASPESAGSPQALKSATSEPGNQRRTGEPDRTVPVPAGFRSASITALSPSMFWALGSAKCDDGRCTTVARTTDGGRTFDALPSAPTAPVAAGDGSARTVRDLRFASAMDGFAFGGALWSTHDGGASWSPQRLPGNVVRLEAARSTVWALVRAGGAHELYRSPADRDSWQRVRLPVQLDDSAADLAVQADTVTVTGATNGRAVSAASSDGGQRFRTGDSPCDPAFGARISASDKALWLFCPTGTQGRPYVSTDAGRSWQPTDATPAGGWPNSTVAGARSADSAVLGAGRHLYMVDDDEVRQAGTPSGAAGGFDFIGFTTPTVGYAVLDRPARSALWRTTDGGRTWSVVRPH
ncbi:MAG: hypothetical protein GEV07_04785 [Streptosporangiales bacterium]|nr:hypothetical protein [Streptosporangiales bacterium]